MTHFKKPSRRHEAQTAVEQRCLFLGSQSANVAKSCQQEILKTKKNNFPTSLQSFKRDSSSHVGLRRLPSCTAMERLVLHLQAASVLVPLSSRNSAVGCSEMQRLLEGSCSSGSFRGFGSAGCSVKSRLGVASCCCCHQIDRRAFRTDFAPQAETRFCFLSVFHDIAEWKRSPSACACERILNRHEGDSLFQQRSGSYLCFNLGDFFVKFSKHIFFLKIYIFPFF